MSPKFENCGQIVVFGQLLAIRERHCADITVKFGMEALTKAYTVIRLAVISLIY